jgi:predicted nucleic acid-binding OB-fold protein
LASATYEQILREVEQLTDEERARLKEVLNAPARPSGADFVAFLETAEPIRPEALDTMEAAIREIDTNEPDGR